MLSLRYPRVLTTETYERKGVKDANQVELEVKQARHASSTHATEGCRRTREARGSLVQEQGGRIEARERDEAMTKGSMKLGKCRVPLFEISPNEYQSGNRYGTCNGRKFENPPPSPLLIRHAKKIPRLEEQPSNVQHVDGRNQPPQVNSQHGRSFPDSY